MATIETLKKSESTVYPQTLEKAIYDDEGTRLDNKLSSIKSDINNLATSTQYDFVPITNDNFSNCKCYKMGNIVSLSIQINTTENRSDGTYLCRIPVTVKDTVFCVLSDLNGGSIVRCFIEKQADNTYLRILTDVSANTWLQGSCVLFTN